MPNQFPVSQEFLADDQDIPGDGVDWAFGDTPSPSLPYATNIMSLNSTTHLNYGLAVSTSTSNHLSGFRHNTQTLDSSTQNYDRGINVGHPGESTPYNSYQWPNFVIPRPDLGFSQVVFVSQPTNRPDSIPLQSHFPFPPLHCRWLSDGIPCTFTGTLEELRVHCRASHFAGPKDAPIACQWEDCEYHRRGDRAVRVMRRDCVWRHTCEIHLFLKRGT
ncbi:hypothetical protein EDB19DRAFT_1155066 [Suillus lakei]|nr:hypothetical protein EDB19DRAFT_1155066 [Suillus lakei]